MHTVRTHAIETTNQSHRQTDQLRPMTLNRKPEKDWWPTPQVPETPTWCCEECDAGKVSNGLPDDWISVNGKVLCEKCKQADPPVHGLEQWVPTTPPQSVYGNSSGGYAIASGGGGLQLQLQQPKPDGDNPEGGE